MKVELNEVCIRPWEKDFRLPEAFNMVSLLLDRHMEKGRGDRIALYHKDQKVTYQDLYDMTNRAGNGFARLGVKKGDRVVIMMYDSPEWIAVFLGAMKIGAVPVPVNILATPTDLAYFISDSKAALLVVDHDLIVKIERMPRSGAKIVVRGEAAGFLSLSEILAAESTHLDLCQTDPMDHSYWLYTSGTTGKPKGVIHLHKDLVYALEVYGRHVGFMPDYTCHGSSKLFFSYGLNMGLQLPLYYCASTALVEDRPTAPGVLANLQKFRPNFFFSVPTAYAQLMHHIEAKSLKPDFSHLKICVSSGESLPAVIYRKWKDRFNLELLDGLGSTEVSWTYIVSKAGEVRARSCGRLLPGYSVKLLDSERKEVPLGVVGDLWVKSETLAPGYWNKPEETAKVFVVGWMKTGDSCSIDADGHYYHSGRSDDMFKVSGIYVTPLEVEATLLEHDAVAGCAVVAGRDRDDLVKPRAFIVLKPGHNPGDALVRELQDYVKSRISPYKYPRWIQFIDELPMTSTGKIQRFKLRDL